MQKQNYGHMSLCDWGEILRRRERLRQPGVEDKAIHILESSLDIGGAIDEKLAMSWVVSE